MNVKGFSVVFAGGVILAFFLLLMDGVLAEKCEFDLTSVKVDVSPNCPNGVPPNSAKLYIQEKYYVCGDVSINNGKITAYNKNIMANQTVDVINGHFYLEGYTNTEQSKYYYISLNYSSEENETCELSQISLKVLDKCDEVAPSSKIIEGDVIEEGKNFTIEIGPPEKEYNLTIQGISNTTTVTLEKGTSWRKSFPSEQCCITPPCSCQISLLFVDAKHEICKDIATLRISVEKLKKEEIETPESVVSLIIIGVIIIGTGVILILNRRK